MNIERINGWVNLVESTCVDLKVKYIDIIIDQAASDFSLLPTLASFTPEIQWRSLFNGLPEEVLLEDAPLLIRIEFNNTLQRQWLVELALQFGETDQILMLCSLWPFDVLAKRLIHCIDVSCGGQDGVLRFYDPRLFPFLFSHVLGAEQKQLLLDPVMLWSWLDRDHFPQQLSGNGASPSLDEKLPKLVLEDQQQEYMMCVGDTKILLNRFDIPESCKLTQEGIFIQCYEGMVAATEAGLIMDNEREAFVKNRLLENIKSVI